VTSNEAAKGVGAQFLTLWFHDKQLKRENLMTSERLLKIQ